MAQQRPSRRAGRRRRMRDRTSRSQQAGAGASAATVNDRAIRSVPISRDVLSRAPPGKKSAPDRGALCIRLAEAAVSTTNHQSACRSCRGHFDSNSSRSRWSEAPGCLCVRSGGSADPSTADPSSRRSPRSEAPGCLCARSGGSADPRSADSSSNPAAGSIQAADQSRIAGSAPCAAWRNGCRDGAACDARCAACPHAAPPYSGGWTSSGWIWRCAAPSASAHFAQRSAGWTAGRLAGSERSPGQ